MLKTKFIIETTHMQAIRSGLAYGLFWHLAFQNGDNRLFKFLINSTQTPAIGSNIKAASKAGKSAMSNLTNAGVRFQLLIDRLLARII
ncbi:hypothetical protein LQZ18_09930 [Lachnospiraceae bacterium ZAX-1]